MSTARTIRLDNGGTETVRRFDRAQCDARKAIVTDEGFLSAPAMITRAGVFVYSNMRETWGELRLPEEVFNPDSLRSFNLRPVVNNHPSGTGVVDPKNAKRLSVGTVGNVERSNDDANYVRADLLITDADAIKQIKSGKVELSCGYFCEREEAPAGSKFRDPVTGVETPYKFIQRNIRGNHLAIVDAARAGPGARIMLDGNDAIEFTNDGTPSEKEAIPMKKITIDGVTFEVAENVEQAFEKHVAATATKISTLSARADAAESQVKDLTEKLKISNDSARFNAAVSARVAVETAAKKHDIKTDGLSNIEIKRAVIAKLDKSLSLDGKEDTYVDVMFDILQARNPVAAQIDDARRAHSKPAPKSDSAEAEIEKKREEQTDGFFKAGQSAPKSK